MCAPRKPGSPERKNSAKLPLSGRMLWSRCQPPSAEAKALSRDDSFGLARYYRASHRIVHTDEVAAAGGAQRCSTTCHNEPCQG
jgi:hypothetical protein